MKIRALLGSAFISIRICESVSLVAGCGAADSVGVPVAVAGCSSRFDATCHATIPATPIAAAPAMSAHGLRAAGLWIMPSGMECAVAAPEFVDAPYSPLLLPDSRFPTLELWVDMTICPVLSVDTMACPFVIG